MQRDGHILGLTSREFLQARGNGSHGRIAITYFEWTGLFAAVGADGVPGIESQGRAMLLPVF